MAEKSVATNSQMQERPLVGLGTIANWFYPPISIPTLRKLLKTKGSKHFYVGRSIAIFASDLKYQLRNNK